MELLIDQQDGRHVVGGIYDRIIVRRSKGVRIEAPEVRFKPNATTMAFSAAVEVDRCSDVVISDPKVVGAPAVNGVPADATGGNSTGNVIGLPCARGISAHDSQGVTIIGGEITGFDRQVVLGKLDRSLVSGIKLRGRRRTAILGSNLCDVTIEGCDVDGASPWRWGLVNGNHADCLAFWGDAGQGRANDRVRVRHNVFAQMSGAAILGVWLQGKAAETPFTNAEIIDNLIMVPNLQGLYFTHLIDSLVARNVLMRVDVAGSPAKQRPTILLREGCSNNTLADNRVSAPISDTSNGGNKQSGTVLLTGRLQAA